MTTPLVQPYLFFNGNCEEAVEFYKTALGAQVQMMMRYSDSPEPRPEGKLPAGFENKVMHVSFRVGGSVLMASDDCQGESKFGGFTLSLTQPTEAEAQTAFNALAEGGKITMPLAKTFWSPCFGMVEDKFGLGWMVTVPEN